MTTMIEEIAQLEEQIAGLRKKVVEARRAGDPQVVGDYTFTVRGDAKMRLSELFGDGKDLILVHNMGRSCPYCTLWADGFVGIAPHMESRCAFVIASPDDPETQSAFAAERRWPFTMVSYGDSTFAKDMGVEPEPGKFWPGVSAFHRSADGTITRTGFALFGPGDDFCSVWHFFDLLTDGRTGWAPKYRY